MQNGCLSLVQPDRGIVICAGGVKYNPCAWVLVRLLRYLGCLLPIEVWHLGKFECDSQFAKLIEPYGVRLVDALRVRKSHPHRRLRGWPIKPYAILHSRFEEVLFLDADNVPIRDPTYLFDCEAYRECGSLFWPDPDKYRTPRDSNLWQIFDVPYRPSPAQESGQLVIHKRRCWKALHLCNSYNENSDFFYRHVYGDKDTFRFAWNRVGQPIRWIERPVSERLDYTLLQHDCNGNELFQHRFFHKWSFIQNNPCIEGFVHEDLCLLFLEELRDKWSPEKNLIRGISSSDVDQMSQLVGRRFVAERLGYSRWPIQLSSHCRLGKGATPFAKFWWVRRKTLVLATDQGRRSAVLQQKTDDQWEGRSITDKRIHFRFTAH